MNERQHPVLSASAYITRADCVRWTVLQCYALTGIVSVGFATGSDAGCWYPFISILFSFFATAKLYLRIAAGEQISRRRPDPRIPKAWELWTWLGICVGMAAAVIYMNETYIWRNFHSGHGVFQFLNALNADIFLMAGTAVLWCFASFELLKYINARRARIESALFIDDIVRVEKPKTTPALAGHWWTSDAVRDDNKQTLRPKL